VAEEMLDHTPYALHVYI